MEPLFSPRRFAKKMLANSTQTANSSPKTSQEVRPKQISIQEELMMSGDLQFSNLSYERFGEEDVELKFQDNKDSLVMEYERFEVLEPSNEEPEVLLSSNDVFDASKKVLEPSNVGLEPSNEGLDSSNEGLESSNEVLDSSDKVLDYSDKVLASSNEVLESTNEVLEPSNSSSKVLEPSNKVLESSETNISQEGFVKEILNKNTRNSKERQDFERFETFEKFRLSKVRSNSTQTEILPKSNYKEIFKEIFQVLAKAQND